MQERNFEKQVKQKMEELSLTPSEPVWKKVEEQIRKRRDRRRLLFWLPLTVLLLGGGIWWATNALNKQGSIAKSNKEEQLNTPGRNTTNLKQPEVQTRKERPVTIGQNQKRVTASENIPEDLENTQRTKTSKILDQSKRGKGLILSESKRENYATGILEKETPVLKQSSGGERPGPDNRPVNKELEEQKVNVETTEPQALDSVSNNIAVNHESVKQDSLEQKKPETSVDEKDSLSVKPSVAANARKSGSTWKFAITAGVGRSGVNNGVQLFGGGAKSMETNVFADLNYSSPQTNTNAGPMAPAYQAPSSQKKSLSFSFGFLAKREISKRSTLSTGLQYNFYSTQMLVGQNIKADTVVDINKNVSSFYANSGSSFSNYNNKFHFIALPIGWELQLLRKKPLDLHVGLSLQHLIATNALLYSARSRVYYEDKSAFNKTYLFSELGIEYAFPLSRKFSLQAGPRVNYSHSKVLEGSSRHLFSYGIATQLIFSGK